MRDVLSELIALLTLERLEKNLFRGQSQDLGWGQIFGGQVLGQALSSAFQTVPPGRRVHSLHGYFLRSGDAARPVIYEVDPIRDGKSFTTRRVVAIQDGQAIFNMAASFQVDEPGFSHQSPMPETGGPEGIASELDLSRRVINRIPEPLRARATADRPIEIRPLDPHNPFQPTAQSRRQQLWYRAAGSLPEDPSLHTFLLAYASDFQFLVTALRPHGVSWLSRRMQVTSLDHAMYFHRPFRLDDWLLYDIESPWAGGARGLVRGSFYDRDGNLVASTFQEGLIRDWKQRAKADTKPHGAS